jgi:hypothetical protein
MPPFLQLEDFLAPPPLPALLAVFMVLGLKNLGSRITSWLSQASPLPLREAAAFVLASALVATMVYGVAMAGAAYLWLLRVLAWSLAVLGLWELSQINWPEVFKAVHRLRPWWQELPSMGKAAVPPLLIAGFCLLLAALGPPTDADSLDYHLGIPLEILRHHGLFLRPDWLMLRLMGLGESLNLLGLAGGTDILGATLQFAGLVAVLVGVMTLAKTDMDRIMVAVLILGCPVLLFLIPNQKPQVLPTAAVTIALLLLVERFRDMDPKTLMLALPCVFFPISCKFFFVVPGAIVVGVALLAAYRARLLGLTVGICLAAYMVLVFPVHLHNLVCYGDPVSPLLERFKTVSDPLVLRFANILIGWDITVLPYPLGLFFPLSLGTLSQVLGFGPLFFFVGLKEARAHLTPKILLGCVVVVVACTLFSNAPPRYYLGPYLWIVAAGAASAWTPGKRLFFKLMLGQLFFVALLVMFGAVTLFPGSLTFSLRDRVMSRASFGYAETRWLNQVLPPDAVVLTNLRSSALIPRPYLSSDVTKFFDLRKPDELALFKSLAIAARVNTLVLVVQIPLRPGNASVLWPGVEGILAGPKEFYRGVRNPMNRGTAETIMVYRFNPKLLPSK